MIIPLKIKQLDFRIIVAIISIIISTSCFVSRVKMLPKLGIRTSYIWGQVIDGNYFVGDYTTQTNELIKNNTIIVDGKVLNRYPPGYPYILYLTYLSSKLFKISFAFALFLMSAFFIAISSSIIAQISFLLFNSKRTAILSGFLFATHPYILQGMFKLMSETPFMAFFNASLLCIIYVLVRHKNIQFISVVLGFLLGVTLLIRPIAILLPFLILLFFFIIKNITVLNKIKISIIILFTCILTIAPWHILNFTHKQKIILSSDNVYSIKDGLNFNCNPKKKKIDLPTDVDNLSRQLLNANFQNRKEFISIVFQKIQENPVPVIKLFLLKAIRSWYGVFDQDSKKEKIKIIVLFFYLALSIGGLICIKKDDYNVKMFFLLLLMLVLYFWFMTIFVVSMVRYLYPVFGLMTLLIPSISKKPILNGLGK